MDYKSKCKSKINEAIDIFVDTFCLRCDEGCFEKEHCPLTMLVEGRVNLFGNSVFNSEDDLCVFDEKDKEIAEQLYKKILERGE